MSRFIRLGVASESYESPYIARVTEQERANFKMLEEERASYGSSGSNSSYSSYSQPEQIGVAISGFGIYTRATPIYAGRRSRLL